MALTPAAIIKLANVCRASCNVTAVCFGSALFHAVAALAASEESSNGVPVEGLARRQARPTRPTPPLLHF